MFAYNEDLSGQQTNNSKLRAPSMDCNFQTDLP